MLHVSARVGASKMALHVVVQPSRPGDLAVSWWATTVLPSMPRHMKESYGSRLNWFHDILLVRKCFSPQRLRSWGSAHE